MKRNSERIYLTPTPTRRRLRSRPQSRGGKTEERMRFLPGMVERTIPGKPRPAVPEGV
ncbi:MAG TPA: hypothetical protein VKF36_02460 [Syntrophorhabdales bacterium]|nr:hypothetical protein [Syntrophorhabdales bacterium]